MANTLKFGNGEWYGKKDTILAYNDENSNYKPLPFDFSRASKATVVNKDGLIETVGSGIPRIDYKDDSKGALLLEPSRFNGITYSQNFDGTNMINSAIITEFNTTETLSPEGINNATKLTANSSFQRYSFFPVIGDNIDISVSVFAKKGSASVFQILVIDKSSQSYNATFDLENGTSSSDGKIEDYGNGWYRCSVTKSTSTGAGTVQVRPFTHAAGLENGWTGSNYIYGFGAQYEVGSYATSYIPTQGSAVTRVADVCNNGGNEQVINSTEGVLYAELSGFSNDLVRYSISDGSNSNNIYIELSSSSVSAVGRLSAVNQFSIYSSQTITNYNKIAIKYKQNDFALWINGVEVGTDTSGNTYPANTLDSFQFNRGDGGILFYGETRDIKLYNTALTDQELAALTTI